MITLPEERWQIARKLYSDACNRCKFNAGYKEEYKLACKIYALEKELFQLSKAIERKEKEDAAVFKMLNGIKSNTTP